MSNPEYNQYRYLKRQEKLTAVPDMAELPANEVKKAWMRKAAAQHKLGMFSEVEVDRQKKTAGVDEMLEATEAGISEAAVRRDKANTDKGKAYWRNVERGLKIKKTWILKSRLPNEGTVTDTSTRNQVDVEPVVSTLITGFIKPNETSELGIDKPDQIIGEKASNENRKSRLQRLIDGEVDQNGVEAPRQPVLIEIVPDTESEAGFDGLRTTVTTGEENGNKLTKTKIKKGFARLVRYGVTAISVYALAKSGLVQWFADKGKQFAEAWSNRDGRPTEIAGIETNVTTQGPITNPIPEATATPTSTVKPEATHTPTVTSEPTTVPEINKFEIINAGTIIDFSKKFTFRWSDDLVRMSKVSNPLELEAIPKTAVTVIENSGLVQEFGSPTVSIEAQIQGDKPKWMKNPNSVGVSLTSYPGRLLIQMHDGSVKVKPSEMSKDYLDAWTKANPGKDPNQPQQIDLMGQILLEAGEKGIGSTVMLVQDGESNLMKIADVRKVSVSQLQSAAATTDASGKMDFDLESLGVSVWDKDGVTISTCADYNSQTRDFENRLLVSLVPIEKENDLFLLLNYTMNLIQTVNNFQFVYGNKQMGDYLLDSQWFMGLSPEEKRKMKPILSSLVNSGTRSFSEGGKGMQCLGWVGIRKGDVKNPLYLGGDGTDKDPAQIVPDIVKGNAYGVGFKHYEIGGREWWTGMIDYRSLQEGDLIMMWNTGAIRQSDGEDSGHVEIVERVWFDPVDKIWKVITTGANLPNAPGQVYIRVIENQEDYNQAFGIESAVLVANNDNGDIR